MARNLHTDYYRDEKKKTDHFKELNHILSDVTDETGEFHEEDYERLGEAFSGLREEQKEIIILSRYQGLKYEEISEITSQSVAAIKVAMHRAIKQLRVIYFKQV